MRWQDCHQTVSKQTERITHNLREGRTRRQDCHRTVSKRTEWTTHGLREGWGTNEAARPSLDRFEGTRTDHSPTKGEMRDDRGGKTISKRNRMDHAQTEGGTKWMNVVA